MSLRKLTSWPITLALRVAYLLGYYAGRERWIATGWNEGREYEVSRNAKARDYAGRYSRRAK